MPVLYSYIVAYDSGFAPNPFNGFCTLATCKPDIRKNVTINDWIVGTGSNRRGVERGGFLVYAMRVQEILTFSDYWKDSRFTRKKPNLSGSYRMACGDNIYCPNPDSNGWIQLNSYHSWNDGTPRQKHINRDTSIDRVLVSNEFVYFGAEGPEITNELNAELVHKGRGYRKFNDQSLIAEFESWLCNLKLKGYQGMPFDMLQEAQKRK
ncbi:MAG: hypothetical protein F4223_04670 [Rhodobacteraceae bacterium]|nr:hypothetical protein [Paracoccaceae bacterium]